MPIRCDQTSDINAIVLMVLLLDLPFSLKGERTRNIMNAQKLFAPEERHRLAGEPQCA